MNLLKELILEKYGTEKFETGCGLLLQWLKVTSGANISPQRLRKLLESDVSPHFSRPIQEAIRKLFGKEYTL